MVDSHRSASSKFPRTLRQRRLVRVGRMRRRPRDDFPLHARHDDRRRATARQTEGRWCDVRHRLRSQRTSSRGVLSHRRRCLHGDAERTGVPDTDVAVARGRVHVGLLGGLGGHVVGVVPAVWRSSPDPCSHQRRPLTLAVPAPACLGDQAQSRPWGCPLVVRVGHDQHFHQPGGHRRSRHPRVLRICQSTFFRVR